jgi:hypothetical protein
VRDSTTCSTACISTNPTCGSRSTTDTAGFTDHVFALMHLLGFRFARASVTGRPDSSSRAMPPRGVETDDRRHQHQRYAPLG